MRTSRIALAALALALCTPLAWSQATGTAAPKAPAAEKPVRYDGRAAPAIGIAKAPAKAKGSVRLAAFNVENLFDDKDDPALSGEYDDIKMTTDPTRLKNLAAAIKALDADVLGLEEVESEECLRWFRDTYLQDLGYQYLASKDVGYYRGIEQGVLSRYPIEQVEIFRDAKLADAEKRIPTDAAKRKEQGWSTEGKLTPGFQRSPLHVRVRLPDGSPLELFVLHLKSGPKNEFAFQREMEALTVAGLLDKVRAADPNAQIAAVGDFNAMPGDKAAKVLREKGLGGLISAYELRPEAKGADKGKSKDADEADDDTDASTPPKGGRKGSPDMQRSQARLKYLTHSFVPDDKPGKPVQRTIDYVLLSPNLFRKGARGSFFVLSTPKPIDSNEARPAGYASDHCPVAVDLQLGEAPAAKPASAAPAPASK